MAVEGSNCHDIPDDVKTRLYEMISRSTVGYEREQHRKKIKVGTAGAKAGASRSPRGPCSTSSRSRMKARVCLECSWVRMMRPA